MDANHANQNVSAQLQVLIHFYESYIILTDIVRLDS